MLIVEVSLVCTDTALSQSSIGAQYSKQNMINFSQCLAELAQKFNFFKLAVLRSDSMKRNYEGLIFNYSNVYLYDMACLLDHVHLFNSVQGQMERMAFCEAVKSLWVEVGL